MRALLFAIMLGFLPSGCVHQPSTTPVSKPGWPSAVGGVLMASAGVACASGYGRSLQAQADAETRRMAAADDRGIPSEGGITETRQQALFLYSGCAIAGVAGMVFILYDALR